MRVYIRYALKETISNLWRNRMMTIAAVLTVAVSLSLVGSALLLKQSAAQASVVWQQGTRVTVWMQPTASTSEISGVRSQLADLPLVQNCAYYPQAQNLNEAKQLLSPNEWSVLAVKTMPSSFGCVPTVPSDAFVVINTFENLPGVYQVTAPGQQIREMNKVIRVLQIVFLALAAVMLLSASVLIPNTIRMAIFARRREVSVMKLVGATNWFIRVPFMSEGMIQGLLGSGLAALAVYALYAVINHYGNGSGTGNILGAMHMSGGEVILTDMVVVIVGVVIGSLGSAIAIRRF